MDNGLHGLVGHAVSPVVKEFVKEPESVTTHHLSMVGTTASVTTEKLIAALNRLVLVSLLTSKVL